MILVTVGSTIFPFARMTTLVEHLAHILPHNETIIFQYGHANPHFLDKHVKPYAFLPHAMILAHMKRARLIICHGGPATIYQALSFGKIPWVLPREVRYGEHLNDHQVDFVVFMEKHHLIRRITPVTPIANLNTPAPTIRPIQKSNPMLIRYLDGIIRETA